MPPNASSASRVAIVTGASRGIGLEVCRQLAAQGIVVVVAARDRRAGPAVAADIRAHGGQAVFFPLHVDRPRDITRLIGFVDRTFGRLDILINNAAVYGDWILRYRIVGRLKRLLGIPRDTSESMASTEDPRNIQKVLEINTFGPLRLCQAAIPLMRRGKHGRIVNVPTNMGQITVMKGGAPSYRISKLALNGLTRMLADELRDSNILVNSVHPGHVETRMGGDGAPKSVSEGADTIVWAATLPDDGPTGGFFFERKPFAW
jgi:NAD(P)-dependent dehydrogenase (short-subunit alcohol dehydrogenase family)